MPTDPTSALAAALARRAGLLQRLHAEDTDCYRLLHGAVEGAPGVAVDRYGPVLLVQTWREPLEEGVLPRLAALAGEAVEAPLTPVWNHRARKHADYDRWHPVSPLRAEGRELGLRFDVSPRHRGDDPLLFLDLRAGRRRVREAAAGSVLNLFAYTCGAGVAAAAGGATEVLNVDFAEGALRVGEDNARRNGIEGFRTLREDVFPVIRQLAGTPVGGRGRRYTRLEPRTFDLVVLDPPRWSTGPFGAVDVVRDYPSLLKPVLRLLAPGGRVLATNHVPSVRLEAWLEVLRRTADKAGRPLRTVEVLAPEEDFPSPDARPPLKMAWLEV